MSEPKEKSHPLAFVLILIFMATFFYLYFSNLFMNTDGLVVDSTSQKEHKKEDAPKKKAVKSFSLEKASAESISYGEEKYLAVCTACHGPKGLGDGPAGAALNPPARNFTKLENFKNETSAKGIFKSIEKGIPGSSMASFSFLPENDRVAIVHFIRSLMPKEVSGKRLSRVKKIIKVDPYLKAVLDEVSVEKAMNSLSTNSKGRLIETSSADKVKRLENWFNTYTLSVKVSPYASVYSSKDLMNVKSSFKAFKSFMTSENVFNIIGEGFATLSNDELSALYEQIK